MIKLKDILNEEREHSHCWLSPSGRIIPVDQTHDHTARRILATDPNRIKDPMMTLWKKGYFRVTWMYDGSLIVHNEVMPPNEKQLNILKNIAIEGDHQKIEYDSGGDTKILWSVYDTL